MPRLGTGPFQPTAEGLKLCSRCGVSQDKTFFTESAWRGTGDNQCRICKNLSNREWKYKVRYGMTLSDYDRMLEEQASGCALCGDAPTPEKRLQVDHCHETGRVRGLLCMRCNTALGALGDTESSFLLVLAYLQQK